MIDWLNTVLFTLGNDQVTWAELFGFVTGGVCVWLTVRASIGNFPVGIANSALFLVLFLSARLWADAALQIVFIVLGAIGWWEWVLHAGQRVRKPITAASPAPLTWCLAFVVAATAGLTVLLRAADDSAPFWDALTTALSLAAQYLLNTRRVATWYFWIAADCIYVPLYVTKDLVLTAIVYVLFLGMCVAGLRSWQRESRTAQPLVPATAV